MNSKRSRDKNSTGASPYHVEGWSGATPTETSEERQQRMYAEEMAAERSREIDHYLQGGKKDLDQRKRGVKVLLLGQAESGKSSVLKNFILNFAPNKFESEMPLWKIIIYLNLIGSIKTIFDALEEEYQPKPGQGGRQASNPSLRVYQRTRLGLSPLKIIEANILALLAPECHDSREMVVRAGSGWKNMLQAKQTPLGKESDPSSILIAQKDDIEALWFDDEVQRILARRRPRLRQSSGFFMDDVSRILTPDYVPTKTDILRARIRTMGVEEHYIRVETGPEAGRDYYFIDVGGSKSQRASWAPFFDDVNVIVFLAPLLFNEFLEEDNAVNRLEDSMLLWRDICENKLLAKAHIVLFLNKRDVLEATLQAGVKVKAYVPSFNSDSNDINVVTKYFLDKFRIFHKRYSPNQRPFICYETSAINVRTMEVIIASVRDSVLHQHLRDGDMI